MTAYDPKTAKPCHLIATPGDKRTICGQKVKDVPYGWAAKTQPHIDNYGLVVCDDCLTGWNQTDGHKPLVVPS